MAWALKTLRTLHSWLGVVVLPWVIIFGISGFYLNHPDAVRAVLPFKSYSETDTNFPTLASPLTPDQAADIAREPQGGSAYARFEKRSIIANAVGNAVPQITGDVGR